MRESKSERMKNRKQKQKLEANEIEVLDSWIDSGKPDRGFNLLSLSPLPADTPVGQLGDGTFSRFAGCGRFSHLPLSKKTKDGLRQFKYVKMTAIQRASLPHALCGRDILGAAKTGSGKTLAYLIPVLEKLYREKWGPEFGVGCIIMSPTRELADQIFDVLKSVGKHHGFSAGLLIGGRKDVETEKENVDKLNILICTPGRLLQHMDETPNFDCSELKVLVLDEADRILDVGFRKDLDAIISQLPKQRQTLLFSATQTKSVQDLARLSLKDPEYISVHEESITATPSRLQQTAIIVPLDQKLDMLWSFIKSHMNSKILVFLSSCKQVKFVFETFKKLRPGIPLKCLHGRMKQNIRMGIYSHFCETRSVLFSTDVAARGLDFNKGVDWVVQVDCPENADAYIHRVGRTARYQSMGRSVLFVLPSEMKMLEKLQAVKIPLHLTKANSKRLESVSGMLRALLVKYPDMQQLAQRAFITYLRSIHLQRDKDVFDVTKLAIDEFSASLGLPMTPKIRFLNQKSKSKTGKKKSSLEFKGPAKEDLIAMPKEKSIPNEVQREEVVDKEFQMKREVSLEEERNITAAGDIVLPTRVSKKKKLKINIHRPTGTRVLFDEDGNKLPPFAAIADKSCNGSMDPDKVHERYSRLRVAMKQADKEDKFHDRQRLKEKRTKQKMKLKGRAAEDDEDVSGSDEPTRDTRKKSKIYFDSDGDDGVKKDFNSVSLAEQESLALKLLNSMHS